jgi:hypothetical protein
MKYKLVFIYAQFADADRSTYLFCVLFEVIRYRLEFSELAKVKLVRQ